MRTVAAVGLWVVAAAVSCAVGGRVEMDADLQSPAMNLKDLYDYCGLPSACSDHAPWEGQEITLIGYVDPDNIFLPDKRSQQYRGKFAVSDRQGRTIEVFPQGRYAEQLFGRLIDRPADLILITGRLAAFKMHAGSGCMQGAKVLIHDPGHIRYIDGQ